jgi:signal transduction histidine kinase
MSYDETADRDVEPLAIGVGFDIHPDGGADAAVPTPWEHFVDRTFTWLPYATLAVSAVVTQLGEGSASERATSAGLVVIAALWTWLTFTRMGPPTTQSQSTLRIYFFGFVVIAIAMLVHDPVFLVYALTGFLHASLLRPWPLAFAGLAATSLMVYSGIVFPGGGPVDWAIYLALVAFQTAAVGFGLYAGTRLTDVAVRRRAAIEELEAARVENEGLHIQLIAQAREAGVLDERERFAREMHDTIAQGLAGVITQIEAVQQNWGDDVEMRRHLDNASSLARTALGEARRAVYAIRPAVLEDHRLPEAIRGVAGRWSEMTGIPVEVLTTGDPQILPVDVEVVLLRVAQESLANVDKHAEASRVGITLSYMGESVALDTRDDGVGFEPNRSFGGSHFGLAVMRQRTDALGGSMHVESSPGSGTAVSVRLPLEGRGDG